jgi:choloylglycine hydrolase
MDWYEDMQTSLVVYPRGRAHDGGVSGKTLKWKSKYGSLVATAYEGISTNGMNEQGLAAHMLGLHDSDYGKRDEKVPGLSVALWIQFYLDNFGTVSDAVKFTETHSFQLVDFIHPKVGRVELHLALEDASGDSAIIEYTNGSPTIYHGNQYAVLTNAPTLDQQLINLKQYAGFGGDKPLPGTTFPGDRFVRASYYLEHMSESASNREAIFKVFSILQNAGQPFGTASPERTEEGHIFESLWRSVSDLTNHVYYFNSTMNFNIIWMNLDQFNLAAGAHVMKLDLDTNVDLSGDVTTKFKPV